MSEILDLNKTLVALPFYNGFQYWVNISDIADIAIKRKIVNALSDPSFNRLATFGATVRLIPALDGIVYDEQQFLAPRPQVGLLSYKSVDGGRGMIIRDAIIDDGEEIVVAIVREIPPNIKAIAKGAFGLTDLAGLNASIWISADRKKFNAIDTAVRTIIPYLPRPTAVNDKVYTAVPFYYNPLSGIALIRGLAIKDQVEYTLPAELESILRLFRDAPDALKIGPYHGLSTLY